MSIDLLPRQSELPSQPEALIKEARRLRRRRWLLGTVAALLVFALVATVIAAIAWSGGPGGSVGVSGSPKPSPSGTGSGRHTTVTEAMASEGPTPDVLFASAAVQVIAETGIGCTKVYLSTDFVHFHQITPTLPTRKDYAPTCGWFDASFVSPTDGWLVAVNSGGGPSVLVHTTDGGRTWRVQHPASAEGSEAQDVGFSSPNVGWSQVSGDGANLGILQHTTDAGASWTTVHTLREGCWWLPDVFSTSAIGFQSRGLTAAWRTENGGATWTELALRAPRGVPSKTPAIFETPVFRGLSGTLPVLYLESKRVLVAFDVTSDGGRAWRLLGTASLHTHIALVGASESGCGVGVPLTTQPLPLMSAATPGFWWLLDRGGASGSLVMTIAFGPHGLRTLGHRSAGLPTTATAKQLTLTAADGHDAYLGVGNGREVLYESTDGGARWTPTPHQVP